MPRGVRFGSDEERDMGPTKKRFTVINIVTRQANNEGRVHFRPYIRALVCDVSLHSNRSTMLFLRTQISPRPRINSRFVQPFEDIAGCTKFIAKSAFYASVEKLHTAQLMSAPRQRARLAFLAAGSSKFRVAGGKRDTVECASKWGRKRDTILVLGKLTTHIREQPVGLRLESNQHQNLGYRTA